MKFFSKKSIWSKIVIVLVIVLLLEFVVTKPSLATTSDTIAGFGGKLLSPVIDLLLSLGDALVGIMHDSIMGTEESLIMIDLGESGWEWLARAAVWVLAAATAVGAFLLTGGIIGPLVAGFVIGTYGSRVVKAGFSDNVSRCNNIIFKQNNTFGIIFACIYN